MVTLDWDLERTDGVTLVELFVAAERECRVRIANRLDGAVWPPRREGRPAAGWDGDEYAGTVPADGRLTVGYATPARPADPPAEIVSTGPPDATVDREQRTDGGAQGESVAVTRGVAPERNGDPTPDDVVRSLGDPVVPRDCVPVPDASTESATTDGSPTADEPATTGDIDDCERADELEGGPDGELGRRRGKRCPDGDRRTEAPTRTDASADAPVDAPADGPADAPADTSAGTALVVPGGVRAWLRDVERRLDDVETGAGRKPGDGTHSPTDGTRSPTAEGRDAGLGTAVAVDRRALSWVARRVERLASRADGVR